MESKKVYICGSITNGGTITSKDEIEQKKMAFMQVEAFLVRLGYHVHNPVRCPEKKSWNEYMRFSVTSLMTCDYIYLVDGWHQSKGASVELFLGLSLDIPVLNNEISTKFN